MANLVCNLCQIRVSDHEDHYFGKLHQLALHKDHLTKLKEKCGVFITGWPNMVKREEIESFLHEQGKIVDMYMDPLNKFVILQFVDEETAKKVLNMKTIFRGRTLVVRPRKLKENQNHQNGTSDLQIKQDDNFIALLEEIKDLNVYDQLQLVVRNLQEPHSITSDKYRQLCSDIQRILKYSFPECSVYPFGSTITGLDFHGSDVDIYVDIPAYYTSKIAIESRAAHLVKLTRDILYRCSIITKIVCIPNAKTPIVKCVHQPTGISCDINFKNMLGVCNTYLIRYYLHIDFKLIPIAVTLKKWGKLLDLIGANGKISCYGLIILFIFYLQQEPFYFPSVKSLQSDYNVKEIHDHWNGGFFKRFKPDVTKISNLSSSALLHGFFKYFSEFDYSLYIISPYMGKPVEKSLFLNNSKLPPGFKLYMENLSHLQPLNVDKALCIQDPFEQNNNITKGVNEKFLDEFVSSCKVAAKIFEGNSSKVSLLDLFTGNSHTQKCLQEDGSWEFGWKLKRKQLYFRTHPTFGVIKNRIIWMKTAVSFVRTIITDVFKFAIKGENRSNINKEEFEEVCKLKGTCYINLWESRKLIERDLVLREEFKGIIDKQKFISNYICKDLLKDKSKTKPTLEIDMVMSLSSTELVFRVKKIYGEESNFRSFCVFFNNVVQNWFELYEKELNAEILSKISNNAQQSSDEEKADTSESETTNLINEPTNLDSEVIVIDD